MGGAIVYAGQALSIINSVFEHNALLGQAFEVGGAIYVSSNTSVAYLSDCIFRENEATFQGGAVAFRAKRLRISQTHFMDNKAQGFKLSTGGALSTIDPHCEPDVEILDSTFNGNSVKWAGGAINQEKGWLFIRNASFKTSAYFRGYQNVEGEVIFSSGKIKLENINIQAINKHSTHTSLVMHIARLKDINITNVSAGCSPGKDISACLPKYTPFRFRYYKVISGADLLVSLSISCSSCSPHTYSLSGGKLGPNITSQVHVNCYACPFGGNCIAGQTRASDNFWGHEVKNNYRSIRFVSCPSGYCCTGIQCKN